MVSEFQNIVMAVYLIKIFTVEIVLMYIFLCGLVISLYIFLYTPPNHYFKSRI